MGQYDFQKFNIGVNWLFERHMKPMQHMLFGPDQYEPPWVVALTSVAALEALMQDRIRSIMESNDNKSKVHVWNVVNESMQWSDSDGSYFPATGNQTALVFVKMGWEDDASGLSGEDKINDRHPVFIRKAFTCAAQFAAGKLELRDNTIERPNRKARAFYQLARHLKNSGVKIDGVGLQCHFDLDGPKRLDAAGLATEIKKYRDLGLEVYLDEVDIGCATKEWNDQIALRQKEEYKKLMAVALRAGVNQVHFWGLRDDDENWRRGEHPLLFAADNTPKPAYYGVQEALIEFLAETAK
jgi:endo-1,4-beta-xylanase